MQAHWAAHKSMAMLFECWKIGSGPQLLDKHTRDTRKVYLRKLSFGNWITYIWHAGRQFVLHCEVRVATDGTGSIRWQSLRMTLIDTCFKFYDFGFSWIACPLRVFWREIDRLSWTVLAWAPNIVQFSTSQNPPNHNLISNSSSC